MVGTKTKVKTLPISLNESLSVTKNTIRIGLSTVCFLRNLFPDDVFRTKEWCGVNIKVFNGSSLKSPNKNANAYNLVQLLEKGVFDALEKGYIERLLINVLDKDPKDNPHAKALECYAFRFGQESQQDSQGQSFGKSKEDISSDTRILIKRLVMLTGALDPLPQTTWLTVNIIYNSTVPFEYEPPLMESIKQCELPQFGHSPLSIKIGELDTGYSKFVLKLRRPDEEQEMHVPPTIQNVGAESQALNYDSDYQKLDNDNDDATVVSNDGLAFGEDQVGVIEETQLVNVGLTSDADSISKKQKESLYQSFREIVKRNPGADTKALLDESELGSVLSADVKREFLGRIGRGRNKRRGSHVDNKKRKPLESIENFHMTQDTMYASQENADPFERVSCGRKKIRCIQTPSNNRLNSIACSK